MMKHTFYFLILFTVLQSCQGLSQQQQDYSDAMTLDSSQYNTLHTTYKETALFHRRFKHQDVDSLVQSHRERGTLSVEEVGKSAENRSIYKLQYGKGDKVVMLWSQMHGDEPTATMALFDLFNFLESKDDGFDEVRTLLQDKLTLHFIPMLNPDGAERYARRNAQYIDLNRDARKGQTVEGGLLRKLGQSIKPSYGFNLHDQNIYYNVPGTKNPVTISLLAPAYNEGREVNEVRKGAMQIIVGINNLLQQYIPDAVAKYDDTYSPRGFGDNFQSWGASTVLIESGGLKGDPEKQEIRKLNFAIILNALIEIAQDSYRKYDAKGYDEIPFNASQMHDVVIRNIEIGTADIPLKTDIALRRGEITVGNDYFVRGRIEDIGDLEDSYGYDDVDAEGLRFIQGKTYEKTFESVEQLDRKQIWDLLRQGYIAVRVQSNKGPERLHDLPIVAFTQQSFIATPQITISGTSNFFVGNGETLRYAVVNGYLIDLNEEPPTGIYKNRVN
ncbi:M14 family zinc carboxypeptidase [Sphingobacterium wenxiniae]|uniref:Zinc carboxypeptidase n=1 Tax=Sphingobacterium wenxiniae TaxID=683125 RepID=A0A1I6QQF7_9SPHI|nr:M14 family zinc carboxypeptidase [Sphingobacterium wenxiniae]SFS54548.1 Zinc carboxypeptidase [Sphingobacterium wenxiniae]